MKKVLTLISLLLFIPSLCFAQKTNFEIKKKPGHPPLKLTVKADKATYKVGDEINLNFAVENVSNGIVKLLRDTNPTHVNLIITSQGNKRCRSTGAQVGAGTNAPVSLAPLEIFEYSQNGKIIQDKKELPLTRYKKDGYEEVSGIFIEFPTWSVYLEDGPGKYNIKAKYTDGGWAIGPGDEKPPKDLWSGTLFSQPIQIEITE